MSFGWTRDAEPITACHVPKPMEPVIAKALTKIHGMLCARIDDPGHKVCVGKMTVERGAVTLNCPLCGDLRSTMPAEAPHA